MESTARSSDDSRTPISSEDEGKPASEGNESGEGTSEYVSSFSDLPEVSCY